MWYWALAVALAFIAYAPALDNFFIADDFNWLHEAATTWRHPTHVFSLVIANFFRPMVHVWFALLRPAFDLHPAPYYAAAILAHGLTGVVVAWATARLTADRLAGGLAGLVFILHFTHFDAVYWLSAISDILGTLLTTVAVTLAVAAVRGRGRAGWGALALTPLVLMCKESMVMVVPLLAWTVWSFAPARTALRRAAVWLAPAALFWGGYLAFERGVQATSPHVSSGYYALGAHAPRMLLNAFVNFLVPNRFVLPAPLVVVVVAAGVVLGVGWGLTRRLRPGGGRLALFFLGWIVLAFLPCAFFRNYDRIPSRYSYLPSVAFAAAVGWWAAAAWRGMTPRARPLTLAAVLGIGLLNVAYLWRIDRVRYGVHSRLARAFAAALVAAGTDITPQTTLLVTNLPPPLGAPHIGAAAALYAGAEPARRIVAEPGAPPPAPPPGPVVWLRWDPERTTFTRVAAGAPTP